MLFDEHTQSTSNSPSPYHFLDFAYLLHIHKPRINHRFSQTKPKPFFTQQLISVGTVVEEDFSF